MEINLGGVQQRSSTPWHVKYYKYFNFCARCQQANKNNNKCRVIFSLIFDSILFIHPAYIQFNIHFNCYTFSSSSSCFYPPYPYSINLQLHHNVQYLTRLQFDYRIVTQLNLHHDDNRNRNWETEGQSWIN